MNKLYYYSNSPLLEINKWNRNKSVSKLDFYFHEKLNKSIWYELALWRAGILS